MQCTWVLMNSLEGEVWPPTAVVTWSPFTANFTVCRLVMRSLYRVALNPPNHLLKWPSYPHSTDQQVEVGRAELEVGSQAPSGPQPSPGIQLDLLPVGTSPLLSVGTVPFCLASPLDADSTDDLDS